MNDEELNRPDAGRDNVERLLGRAAPRPAPPAEHERQVRGAVYAEWRRQVGRRRRQHLSIVGLAATVVGGAMLAFYFAGGERTAPIDVARIERQFGATYFVNEDAGLVTIGDAASLMAGQTVQTARASGLAFSIDGVSVRLDADSRMQVLDRGRLYLERGRVYLDTPPQKAAASLVVRTDQGAVSHLGTQFMVAIAGDELTVSVREGQVHIDGHYFDATAAMGERVLLRGTDRPVVGRVSAHSEQWHWTEFLAPRHDIDGMSADDFFTWVGEETGYRIVYDDATAGSIASATVLKGAVDEPPRQELRLRLLTMDLAYEIDDTSGEIRILKTDR